jgi:hypothetical protein
MVASRNTIKEVIAIIRKYIEADRLKAMFDELENVPGNASFRETVIAMRTEYKEEEKRKGKP